MIDNIHSKIYGIIKRQHVKVSIIYWSSKNRMQSRQNQFTIRQNKAQRRKRAIIRKGQQKNNPSPNPNKIIIFLETIRIIILVLVN